NMQRNTMNTLGASSQLTSASANRVPQTEREAIFVLQQDQRGAGVVGDITANHERANAARAGPALADELHGSLDACPAMRTVEANGVGVHGNRPLVFATSFSPWTDATCKERERAGDRFCHVLKGQTAASSCRSRAAPVVAAPAGRSCAATPPAAA